MAIGGGSSAMKLTGCSLIECGPHRLQSRSVSWNVTGTHLAMGSSDSTVRVWSLDVAAANAKEVLSIAGFGGPVLSASFHPAVEAVLCATASDATVRVYDVRTGGGGGGGGVAAAAAPLRVTGKIDAAAPIVAARWNAVRAHALAVTTRDGSVAVYDTRKLGVNSTSAKTAALHTVSLQPGAPETCVFDPTGDFLVAGTTNRGQGMGCLKVWNWLLQDGETTKFYTYPAHAGPVYAMAFSSDGKQLATGGSDAVVGLWDVPSMSCCHTATGRTKFVRSVAFSPDGNALAIATEEDAVELVDAASMASIGLANLGQRPRSAGAEDVTFHPTSRYLLACARTDTGSMPPAAPVTVAKLSFSR